MSSRTTKGLLPTHWYVSIIPKQQLHADHRIRITGIRYEALHEEQLEQDMHIVVRVRLSK